MLIFSLYLALEYNLNFKSLRQMKLSYKKQVRTTATSSEHCWIDITMSNTLNYYQKYDFF